MSAVSGDICFFAVQGLAKAENVAVYYDNEPEIEKHCTYDAEFCSVGWIPPIAGDLPDRDYFAREFEHRDFFRLPATGDFIFRERVADADLPDSNSVFVEEATPPYDVEQVFIDEREAALRRTAKAEAARLRWQAYETLLAPYGVVLYDGKEFEQLELQTNISQKVIDRIHKRGVHRR